VKLLLIIKFLKEKYVFKKCKEKKCEKKEEKDEKESK
jgi:hypothetical protein